jgi:hypothetical protein
MWQSIIISGFGDFTPLFLRKKFGADLFEFSPTGEWLRTELMCNSGDCPLALLGRSQVAKIFIAHVGLCDFPAALRIDFHSGSSSVYPMSRRII